MCSGRNRRTCGGASTHPRPARDTPTPIASAGAPRTGRRISPSPHKRAPRAPRRHPVPGSCPICVAGLSCGWHRTTAHCAVRRPPRCAGRRAHAPARTQAGSPTPPGEDSRAGAWCWRWRWKAHSARVPPAVRAADAPFACPGADGGAEMTKAPFGAQVSVAESEGFEPSIRVLARMLP